MTITKQSFLDYFPIRKIETEEMFLIVLKQTFVPKITCKLNLD